MTRQFLAMAMLALGGLAEAQTPPPAPRAPQTMRDVAPPLAGYTDNILFGEVWVRPGLAPRDRSLVTISSLIAGGRSAQLANHLRIGLENGLKPGELSEVFTHLAFYSGWPNAVSATNVAHEVFKAQGIAFPVAGAPAGASPVPRGRGERASPGVPALAEYTDRILDGDLWQRPGLAPRDRSLATIAALVTTGDAAQLNLHLRRGIDNGLTREQVSEAINHLAFYAGWPKAMAAASAMGTAFGPVDAPASAPLTVVAAGTAPSNGPASNFTGAVTVDTGFAIPRPSRLSGARVTFAAGARTNWHSHPLGQTLIVTAGRGLVQEEGGAVRQIGPGDVVVTAPGVKHWHGAVPDDTMTHYAVSERGDGQNVTWLEPVTDAQYRARR